MDSAGLYSIYFLSNLPLKIGESYIHNSAGLYLFLLLRSSEIGFVVDFCQFYILFSLVASDF